MKKRCFNYTCQGEYKKKENIKEIIENVLWMEIVQNYEVQLSSQIIKFFGFFDPIVEGDISIVLAVGLCFISAASWVESFGFNCDTYLNFFQIVIFIAFLNELIHLKTKMGCQIFSVPGFIGDILSI